MSNPGNHPTLEELAAYIDGMLSKAEAAPVAEHLTECEDCNFVYSETVRFQLEHPSEDLAQLPKEAQVIPFPERPRALFRLWLEIAAAAMLTLIAGAGWYIYYFQAPPPPLATSALVASLPEKSKLSQDLWVGRTFRGNGDEGVIAPDASFKFGVQLVNLQVSLEANDKSNADDILTRILGLLKENVAVDELTEFYGGLRKSLQEGTPPRALAGIAAAKAQEFREWFDPISFDLGQWTAAGRLAAIAQEPSFFQGRTGRTTRQFLVQCLRHETSFLKNETTRRFVPQLLRPEEMEIDPDVLPHLKDIADLLKKGALESSDYKKLQRQFEAILQSEYPQPGAFKREAPLQDEPTRLCSRAEQACDVTS